MQSTPSRARALLEGDRRALADVAGTLLKPLKTNFVERPWGGMRIRGFKGLCPLPDQRAVSGMGLGEAFEIAAWDADGEAREHPSLIRFADGSQISLPELLTRRGDELLGREFTARHGSAIPLLPKILDIKELLSVQGHPEGNTEVYVIIDAEPGATIRLGFSEDIDAASFESELLEGRRQQARLLKALGEVVNPNELQETLSPWIAQRQASLAALPPAEVLGSRIGWDEVGALLTDLKALYWRVLDSMNAIPVEAGQVIYNATPRRILRETGKGPSAEVHALGNPENKEILALEIRRPGPTFRAWDNVRFPIRDVDASSAIAALNLRRTGIEEFVVAQEAVAGRPGIFCSVDSEAFRLEHLRPTESLTVTVPTEPPHCLHAIRGCARITSSKGAELGELQQGESALVPIDVGGYQAEALAPETEIVKVSLPVGA